MFKKQQGNSVLKFFVRNTAACIPEPNRSPEIQAKQLFINNEYVDAKSCKKYPIVNPATGCPIDEVAYAEKADVDCAVEAAQRAMKPGATWRTINASKRGALLNKMADILECQAVYIASLETLNAGKPFTMSYSMDTMLSIGCLRHFAGWADKIDGRTLSVDGEFSAVAKREPIGIVAGILSFDFPLLGAVWKIAPALAAGNAVIIKPAQQTPLTTLFLGCVAREACVPAGVLNILSGGCDTGQELVAHPGIDMVAFAGKTETGQEVLKDSAATMKRTLLSLSGKAPVIVCEDVSICEAVEIAHFAVFFNMGQVASSGSRTLVPECQYDEFVKKSCQRAKKRIVGDPFCAETEQGPQIDEKQMNRVLCYINSATEDGAKLQTGGQRLGSAGYFVEPTIFSEVTPDMRISLYETFGPVQGIMKYRNIDEAIAIANDTKFPLAAGVLTKDLDSYNCLTQALKFGTIWANCHSVLHTQAPFGGFKMSGFGRELGWAGAEAYTELKTVYTKINQKNS